MSEVIRAVLAQDDREELEVVVVDSGSTDGTTELVRTLPVRLHEIPAETFTFGYALNLGAKLAKGRFIAYLSAHSTPTTHNWLRELVEPLRTNPSLVATYGRQEPRNGINPFEEPDLWSAFPPDENRAPVALFSNANCAIRQSILQDHPFDEKLESSEDLVWYSGFDKDRILYVPRASVYHTHSLQLGYWARRFERDGIATIRMQHLHGIVNPYVRQGSGFATTIRDYFDGCRHKLAYFQSNKYYRFIPLIPIFEAVRAHCFSRGLNEGRRRLAIK